MMEKGTEQGLEAAILRLEKVIQDRRNAAYALRIKTDALVRRHNADIKRAKARLRVAKRTLQKLRLARKYGLHM